MRVPAVGIGVLIMALSACSSSTTAADGGSGSGSGGDDKTTVAQFLPHTKAVRFKTIDAPEFEKAVMGECPDCGVILQNAEGDAGNEQRQMDAAIGQGVDAMVVDPVDGQALAGVVNSARQKGIPVISYDALIQDVPLDYYVSFDNKLVGEQIATSLVDQMKTLGTTDKCLVVIKGDAKDNNASVFWSGSEPVIKEAGLDICFETNTPDWSDSNAQREMDQAITKIGKGNIGGVYSMNDSMAAGVVASLKGAGVDLSQVPVTGQDGDTSAIQRILVGEQYMTVWKDTFALASTAAKVALQLARDEKPAGEQSVDNGSGTDIPATLLPPQTVTKENIADTVIKSGFIKVADLCAGPYAKACAEAGIE
ncbi:sugar ABC transporter substrate-binding protein [Nocardioides mesophilus]|uniref:Sugar ABC transporter substrate-binding protein n=1 Tax=Nocardioides mesophilus TaxID=433659 RepID=A0A7G9RFL8_9ACTN|nr:sugar ABC transporter substrate-binding protein [Nocardioides mesophilus]QNN54393.1 sugar ABC transporter substrate-binding protein [Nocardioides mesophilus]